MEFGGEYEKSLKSVLEDDMGFPLTKTSDEYDTTDYVGNGHRVELKCRRANHKRDDYLGWVIPACKVLGTDAPVTVYYYWKADDSLWRIDYEEDVWKDFNIGMPPWTSQCHIWVPSRLWRRVLQKTL